MGVKEFATVKKLNEIHQELKNKFKDNTNDIRDAQQLEDFFNYLVYDKNVDISGNPFLRGMSEETKELIKNSPYIKKLNILQDVNGQKQLSGQAGEEAISYLLLQALAQYDNSIKQRLEKNAKEVVDQIIMGTYQATTLSKRATKDIITKAKAINNITKEDGTIDKDIAKELGYKVSEIGSNAFKRVKNKYGVYAFRQGKIDVNTSLLNIEIALSPEAQKLINLSASVKNYQRYQIHLETVNRKKAYQGIMANLYPEMEGEQTSEIFDYYYDKEKGVVKRSKVAAEHFLHITNLYALSGLGQTYINRINNTVIEENLGARFLIANIANKEIIVVPISQIASSLHSKKYGDLFSYENKEKDNWENRKAIPVYLHLNKYKKLRG